MSDCSTNAMKPKEPPKTCGNCEIIASNAKKDVTCPAKVIGACGNWKPRTDALEQRHQQLEQVVRNMLNYMYAIKESGAVPSCDACHRYEDQFRVLGVSLDD